MECSGYQRAEADVGQQSRKAEADRKATHTKPETKTTIHDNPANQHRKISQDKDQHGRTKEWKAITKALDTYTNGRCSAHL